ncbi:MAG: DUF1887 family CARF protein [Sulfuritalea sp.]|nr:DUF1887 family CARF protein [Sulfuritalea sp.]
MSFDTHVCLVSAQATPNLTPALDEQLKPRRMVLVTSPDMQRHAKALAGVVTRRGIAVEQLDIADAYDYAGIEDVLLGWLSAHDGENAALNVTGGTKLMAMAAQSVFAAGGKPIFYVNAETDDVYFLGRRDLARRLDARVKLRDYLEAHGYRLGANLARPDIRAELRDLADRLIDRVESAGGALGQLNWLAKEAKNSLRSPPLDELQRDSITLRDVIDLFTEAKLMKQVDGRIVFPDEAARAFANGGWLEFHVHRALSDLAPTEKIADHALNLEVTAPDGKTKNELDAAFLHGNRLHIVETKASNLAVTGASGDDKATEAIYKLETLLKLGGLRTRAMLVDYRGKLSAADRARAAASKIRIASGAQLKQLKGELKSWIHETR